MNYFTHAFFTTKSTTIKWVFAVLALFFLSTQTSFSQVNYVTWNFATSITSAAYATNTTNQNAARSTALTNATLSTIGLSATAPTGGAGNTNHRTTGWTNSASVNTAQYLEYSITLTGGQTFQNSTLNLAIASLVSSITTAPRNYSVYYGWGTSPSFTVVSGSNVANATATSGGTVTTLTTGITNNNATIPAPGNTTTTKLTIRISAFGTTSSTGNYQISTMALTAASQPIQPASNYTMTYDGNSNTSGSAPTDGSSPYAASSTVTVLGNTGTLARTNYTFSGWNTLADGSGTDRAAASTFTISANTTLYAKWTGSVTYDGNSNTGGSAPSTATGVIAGATYTVAANSGTLTRTGYTFSGWNTASDGTGTSYTAGSGTFSFTGDIILYAKWNPLSTNANLSALTTTASSLSPTFGSGTIAYTASVANGVTTATVTPTKADAGATIQVQVNGGGYATVASGSASSALTLNVGDNTIDVLVTAEDGATTKTYTITVTRAAAASPTLNAVTLSSALSATYGTASSGVSFAASGSNLSGNITATAQTGYLVSSDNSTYTSSVAVANGATVYVAFSSTLAAGSYNGATAVVLSSDGASNANVTTSASSNTVSQKPLTVISLTAQNKIYDGLTSATVTGTAALVAGGVVNADIVSLSGTPSFNFSSAAVGIAKAIITTNYTLTGAGSGNYSLTQPSFSADITARSLTITANNVSKVAGVVLTGGAGSTAFSSSGLQNAETIGTVTITYGAAGGATGDGNTAGVYVSQVTPSAATAGTFTASNYSISYVAGSVTVTAAPVTIATWNFFGESSPSTSTADGSNANLSSAPVLSRGAGAAISSGSNSFRTVGFQNNGIATTNTDYFQTSFISTTSIISLSTLDTKVVGTASYCVSPGVSQQFAYSLDGTNFTLIGSAQSTIGTPATLSQIDLSNISALQNISANTTITLRFYASGQTTTGGWGFSSASASSSDDGFTIKGIVTAAPPPEPATIALANGTVAAGNASQNSTNNVLYRTDVTVANSSEAINSATFTTAGTYAASDINNLKLWYSTVSTFAVGTSTLLSTKTTSLGAGSHVFSGLTQNFPVGTNYLYVTADINCGATLSNTINVAAIASTDLIFATTIPSGSSFTAGGLQTINAGVIVADNPATFTAEGNGTTGQISAAWTVPAGCYDDFMIIASPAANTGGTPTGDGTAYTASLAYASGTPFGNGYVMYKGSASPQNLTGFISGTTYSIKIFTRKGTSWSAGTEINFVTTYTNTTLTEIVVPQYIHTGGTNARVPSAYCVTLSGLTPNATYRYINSAITSASDNATGGGAGNSIFPGTTQSAAFVEGTPSLTTVYGTFTANGSGSYTGWFITEPTTNERFTAGNQVFFRIRLNDGNNGTFVDRIATTTSSSTVITMSTSPGATNATAIRSTSLANAKDFVCLYDNTAGTGRPLAATYTEDDGNGSFLNLATFISSGVNAVAGAWGVVIPNTLATGVQRIETRSFTTGGIICSATDSDGTWGAVNTVNPTGGSTAIVIATVDAGLNCSSVVLDHTGIAQTNSRIENLNSNDNIISNFRVNTSTYATTLNSISFPIGGTFVAGNVNTFKLYTSTSTSFPGGTALSSVDASALATGATITFTGLAQACAVGNRYFWITADFGVTGSGNTVQVPALGNAAFSFASNASIDTNTITAGGTVTLGILEPSIALSSATIAAGNINDGTVNNVIYRANVAVTVTSASLTSASFTTGGTYVPADVTNFKLWYSTSSTFATGTSTLLVTKTTSLDAGLQAFTGFAQTIPTGTAYLYLTTDLPCATTIGNTINVNAIADTDITFASGTPTGSGSATGDQTITASTPSNATGVVATAVGLVGQVNVDFVLPTACFEEIMIVVAPASNTGTPTGDGSAYNSTLNYGTGTTLGNGKVVYKGISSPQIITGLTTGVTYYFKIFTRNGSLWSSGTTEVTAIPTVAPALTEILVPQYIQGNSSTNNNRVPYAYRATLSNLTANATYRYYNAVVATTENATSNGAGICIFANSTGSFTRTSSPSLSSVGNYATFTTDNTGSYTGWFITEPSGNATRFTPGTSVKMRIILNDGNNGTTVVTRLSTTSAISVINLGTGATTTEGTAIRGTSVAAAKNFVMLWNTTTGTGRPISGTFIESDGTANTSGNSYASFYSTNVEGVSGAWGTIIPNTSLSNGIRRIQQYNLSDGSATGLTATDNDGVWPSGADTTNPTGGTTAIVVTKFEAPLEDIATSSVLSGTTTVCFGTSTDLSVAIIGGVSPYTVVYNDGTTNTTVNSYVSGNPITITSTATATYTLVSVTGANSLEGIGNSGSAIVTVNPIPTATITGTVSTCIGEAPQLITFTGANGTSRYVFTYKVNGGANLTVTSPNASNIATIALTTATARTDVYTLVSVEDLSTGCSQLQTGSATVAIGICTALAPAFRGVTLFDLNSQMSAIAVSGTTTYRFEITNTTTNVATILNFSKPSFNLTQLATGSPAQTVAYGTVYAIRVGVNNGGFTYGTPYNVTTTPNVRITKVTIKQCGTTLPKLNEPIYADIVYNATKYRFLVNGGSIVNQEIDAAFPVFNLTQLVGTIGYNTSYTIRVKASMDGGATWPSAYGATCTVTTPANPPLTRIVSPSCGSTLSVLNTLLYAVPVYGANQYRYEVSGGVFIVRTFITPNSSFRLTSLVGGAEYSTTYSVKVAVSIDNGASWQPYGSACSFTTPTQPIARMSNSALNNVFEVKAFPNPFARHFSIAIQSSSDDLVELKVYDMIGRTLEVQKATVSELSTKEIGTNYPSGVYNVVVSQGDKVQSVRMIKR